MRITILQKVLPHYRIALFDRLHASLKGHGAELLVVYGQEYPGEVPQTVDPDLEWALRKDNAYFIMGKSRLIWQPVMSSLRGSDLVIIEQANSLLVNYLLMIYRKTGLLKLAYWGHGRNMQAQGANVISERFKRLIMGNVDHWFAYTETSRKLVEESGFPKERVTTLNNTYDTAELASAIGNVDDERLAALRAEHGIIGNSVLLYCGGMYKNKNIDFLLRACHVIKGRIPDLDVIFIGNGPEAYKVKDAAAHNGWIHYIGAKYGTDRAPYFKLCDGFLMPGAVGLAIIDSFVAGSPLFTTENGMHGPEMAYLENGVNGFISRGTGVVDYAACISDYLADREWQRRVGLSCLQSAQKYTLPNMVDNFTSGILKCICGGGR